MASKGTDHIRSNRVVDGLVVQIVKKVERLTHDFNSSAIQIRDGTRQAEIQSPEAGSDTRVSPGTRLAGRSLNADRHSNRCP